MSLTNEQAYQRARKALYDAWLDDENYNKIEASEDAVVSIDSAIKRAFPHRATKHPSDLDTENAG